MKRTAPFLTVTVLLLAMSAFQAASSAEPALAPRGEAFIFVTSAADSGPGTLRQALLDAQEGETITFHGLVPPIDRKRLQVREAKHE